MALRDGRISAFSQMPLHVYFREESVGDFYADILVEQNVILELKALKELQPIHEAQIINYLKATGIEVGLLLNFGNPKLEYRRYTRSKQG